MKKKILVLDDSPFMLLSIGDMLKKLNYEVTTVDNGSEACQKVESTRYDMIITDMNMPVMDGLEFAKKVRANPSCKFVPIIMLSSDDDIEKITMAKKVGVSTFLSKPLNEKQLNTILQITLNKRKTSRLPVKLTVFYGENESLTGYTFNVSLGGLFLETTNPLSLGESLKIKLYLPEIDLPLHCQGRVAWVNSLVSPVRNDHPPGMGVEFLNLEDDRKIERFFQSGSWKGLD